MEKKSSVRLLMIPEKNGVTPDVNVFINNESELYPYEHNHDFYEVMFIRSGSLIHSVNGQETIMETGDVCFLRPETAHTVKRNGSFSVLLMNFNISEPFFDSSCRLYGFDPRKDVIPAPSIGFSVSKRDSYEYNALFTAASAGTNVAETQNSAVKLLASKIIIKACERKLSPSFSSEVKNVLVADALKELKDPTNFELSVKEIFKKMPCTHEHLTRLFKKENLPPPNKVFLKNKLDYSCALLKNSVFTVTKIAELSGIYSTGYFNKSFLREYGVTPTEFRASNAVYGKFINKE